MLSFTSIVMSSFIGGSGAGWLESWKTTNEGRGQGACSQPRSRKIKAFPIQGQAAKGWELWSPGDRSGCLEEGGSSMKPKPERLQWPQAGCCSWLADVGCCQLLRGEGRREETSWLAPGQGATKGLCAIATSPCPANRPACRAP